MNTQHSCGVIVVYKEIPNKFLLLKQNEPHSWSFPKGHMEKNEEPKETALRELLEETGIKKINLLRLPILEEKKYKVVDNKERVYKTNKYFIGFVDSKKVTIKKDEIAEYRWVTYEEALDLFEYKNRKEVLKQAQAYLEGL